MNKANAETLVALYIYIYIYQTFIQMFVTGKRKV